MAIMQFQGRYRFLSNFWPAKINLDGKEYSCVECAYQAAKTLNEMCRERIRNATAGQAKSLGRSVPMRKDWERVKLTVMEDLLRQKFKNPELLSDLLSTVDDGQLIEGNTWGDSFWGKTQNGYGNGANHLGTLLMKIREEHN